MNAPIRASLPPMSPRIARLPRDHRGFPVPWFVQWYEGDGVPTEPGIGRPDFRVIDSRKMNLAVRQRRCWICGQPLGVRLAFTIGPMCAINRTISEPPSHFECAEFSAKACPFLAQPRMRRNEKDLPDGHEAPGHGIKRNPGAVCVWVTRSYERFRASSGNAGILFRIGEPESVSWLCEGRDATRAEVLHSINTGLPQLLELAQMQGQHAIDALHEQVARVQSLLPTAPLTEISQSQPPGVSGHAGEHS